MSASTIVIVGTGQGGFQTAASLRDNGFDGRVVMIGDEPGLPYQRPPLSKGYLTGDVNEAGLRLRPASFYANHGIELHDNERVTDVDRRSRRVRTASGAEVVYDHLVLATGARERPLQVPGVDLDGVFGLRTLVDSDALRPRLDTAHDVVIVGAGFIGLELASVAAKRGARVHVVEVAPRPMGRAVSAAISEFFTEAHAGRGVGILFGSAVQRIIGVDGRVTGVSTTDGVTLAADVVLVGIGIVPNVELAAAAGLVTDNGVVVDAELVTADAAISAIGDCAAFPSRFAGGRVRLESVQNAVDHARCVAARLAGKPAAYDAVPWFWSDQGDLRLQIVGLTAGYDTAVTRGNIESGKFSVFCFRGPKLLGIESVNRPADHMAGRRLLASSPALTHAQAADESFDLKAAIAASQRAAPAAP
jgi:3-phenylpropionate/trans-cinnamate dioxygenase ferredoxin reductase component